MGGESQHGFAILISKGLDGVYKMEGPRSFGEV